MFLACWLLLGPCSVSVFSLPRHLPPLLRDFCNSSLPADASLAVVVVETSIDHAKWRGLKEESGAYSHIRSPIHSFANQDYCQYPRQSGEPSPFALVKYSTPSGEPFIASISCATLRQVSFLDPKRRRMSYTAVRRILHAAC